MPANLTQQYLNAEARYRAATSDEEKLECLQEMLREIPKHKGTDHMQADIKRKIAQLKKQAGKKSATARHRDEHHVAKEGAGQVVVVGPPNAGKSALLGAVSGAEPEVADYPFTTRKPQPCMGIFENVQIQLVDTPPIAEDYFASWLPGLVRNADLVALVLDLSSDDLLDEYEVCLARLEEHKLHLEADPAEPYGPEGVANKKTHIVATKADAPGAEDHLALLRELVAGRFEIVCVSATRGDGLDAWMRRLFDLLEIIRVYAKQRGKPPETGNPVVLERGSAVKDFARSIHKDFEAKLKYAKIWGKGKYDGQMVNRDYVLEDEDVVELHI